ncbi:Aspercryptin biosynthesis cluster-specific transcription regulator atnN [Paramyrothecium foliicola]|nr:Aspercryptin biosynthesis cluster-specific transcription regulator atnN [Paramyrothecium foliicola]
MRRSAHHLNIIKQEVKNWNWKCLGSLAQVALPAAPSSIRRVKCDETKPHCKRCINTGRTCEGYLAASSTVTRRQLAAASRQLSSLGQISQALSQYPRHISQSPSPDTVCLFDFFRYATVPATASYFPSDFWTSGLLQLAHSEPAIWHAAIALGALHRRWEVDTRCPNAVAAHSPSKADLSQQALEHHASAMSRAKELNDPYKVLVLSLALVAISNTMGRWSEGRLHFAAGVRLLQDLPPDRVSPSAVEMLSRIDLQTMTFEDSSAPYPYAQAEWLTQADRNLQSAETIDSYAQASTGLFALLRRVHLIDEPVGGVLHVDQIGPRESEIRRDLYDWERKMAKFERRNRSSRVEAAAAIRLYHTVIRLMLAVATHGPETRWDRFLGYYERILACVEVLKGASQEAPTSRRPFSLELGMVLPLYLTAARCRHPILRRRALTRLMDLNSQEGVWNSAPAAAVAKKLISIEERTEIFHPVDAHKGPPLLIDRALSVPWEAWTMGDVDLPAQTAWEADSVIPETSRVRATLPLVSLDNRCVNLTLIMSSENEECEYGAVVEESVFF